MKNQPYQGNIARRETGVSLVEIMIALAIGLIIMAAVTSVFVVSNQARNETQKATQQQESGRYAAQLLADNLTLAGFLAEFDPTMLDTPAALPNPCDTADADLITALPLHVQGYNNGGGLPGCISDVKSGTDVIVVRRASSCIAGGADCAALVDGIPHIQASRCRPGSLAPPLVELDSPFPANHFMLSSTNANLTYRRSDCLAFADIQRYLVQIYFIANNNQSGDGIPTLKMWQLGSVPAIVALVDGIENMQIEYGLDGDGNGTPESYTPLPADTGEWRSVVAARIHLLARNTTTTLGYTDTRSYTLGRETDGSAKVVAPGGYYKRHVYTTTAYMANPSGRLQ